MWGATLLSAWCTSVYGWCAMKNTLRRLISYFLQFSCELDSRTWLTGLWWKCGICQREKGWIHNQAQKEDNGKCFCVYTLQLYSTLISTIALKPINKLISACYSLPTNLLLLCEVPSFIALIKRKFKEIPYDLGRVKNLNNIHKLKK